MHKKMFNMFAFGLFFGLATTNASEQEISKYKHFFRIIAPVSISQWKKNPLINSAALLSGIFHSAVMYSLIEHQMNGDTPARKIFKLQNKIVLPIMVFYGTEGSVRHVLNNFKTFSQAALCFAGAAIPYAILEKIVKD